MGDIVTEIEEVRYIKLAVIWFSSYFQKRKKKKDWETYRMLKCCDT